ncbi:MAG TPA: FHA domain-containing protein [Desulfuromonadaceae bacterium]
MPTIRIPTGATVLPPQPFTRELLDRTLGELCAPRRDFTGVVAIESGDTLHLLFLFQSRPYAAGKAVGDKPSPLTIREFFRETGQMEDSAATISIHACDPVLLKSLLIFTQGDPTAKAPASLINLEAILDQIRRDGADSLIILERQRTFNLFYFRGSTQGMAYVADADFRDGEGLPFDEQMLVYAFQPGAEVNALIYRDVATSEAEDALLVNREEMLRLWGGERGTEQEQAGEVTAAAETHMAAANLVLEILNGPRQGELVSGPVPGVLGRKDADIIVADPMVSKRHAAVQVLDGVPVLVDLNSTSGTTLNGTHVVQCAIAEGDVIGIGATALKVVRLTPP